MVVGVLRIFKGWPPYLMIIKGIFVLLTLLAPAEPLALLMIREVSRHRPLPSLLLRTLCWLGHGHRGRNPMLDGFGLIALASVMPIIFVLLFGIVGLDPLQRKIMNIGFFGTLRDILPIVAIILASNTW